jgi:thioredoxin-related protein
MYEKKGQKVLNQKVCGYLPSRQILNLATFSKKGKHRDLKIRLVYDRMVTAYFPPYSTVFIDDRCS